MIFWRIEIKTVNIKKRFKKGVDFIVFELR